MSDGEYSSYLENEAMFNLLREPSPIHSETEMNAEKLIEMRDAMLGQMRDLVEQSTAFTMAVKRAPKELPPEPGDTFKRFDPGPETIITIKVRHDDEPPLEYIRNPPSLSGVPIECSDTMGEPTNGGISETEHNDCDGEQGGEASNAVAPEVRSVAE